MFGTSLEELSQAGGLKAFGASLVNIGTSIGKFLISPVGIAVVVLTSLFMLFSKNKQTVIDFNDGLLNVSKTTGLTGRLCSHFPMILLVFLDRLKPFLRISSWSTRQLPGSWVLKDLKISLHLVKLWQN